MNIGFASHSPTAVRRPLRCMTGMLILVAACLATPARAAQTCAGALQGLSHYAGSGDTIQLMAEPAVKRRLDALLGLQGPHLQSNLGVVGAVELDACHLVVSGGAPHLGGEEEAIVDIALADGRVTAAILSKRQIALFTDSPAAASQPHSILVWIRAHRDAIVHGPQGLRIVLPRPDNARLAQAQAAKFSGAVYTTVSLEGQATPQQRAAVERVMGKELREMQASNGSPVGLSVANVDLNGDGRPDLLVSLEHTAYCGSAGCSGIGILATPTGYATKSFSLPNFNGTVHVLKAVHDGMHDLRFDKSRYIFTWKGGQYR